MLWDFILQPHWRSNAAQSSTGPNPWVLLAGAASGDLSSAGPANADVEQPQCNATGQSSASNNVSDEACTNDEAEPAEEEADEMYAAEVAVVKADAVLEEHQQAVNDATM